MTPGEVVRTNYGRRPPQRRRSRRPLAVLIAVIALAVIALAIVGPWFSHFGLWGGAARGAGAKGGGALRLEGVDDRWHNKPVNVRFIAANGDPAKAEWRIDDGSWAQGSSARVAAPSDHSNDGEHTLAVRISATAAPLTQKIRIDTQPPAMPRLQVTPTTVTRTTDVKVSFSGVDDGAALVSLGAVDSLGAAVGTPMKAEAAAGSLTWRAQTDSGGPLFPGVYRLRLSVADAAGNTAVAEVPLTCERPVKAQVISRLPKAGREVALTFDGGSGYAWRHMVRTLAKQHAGGTFFCTGVSVERYPPMARESFERHMVSGNHSFDHPDFRSISYEEARSQLLRNARAWHAACGAGTAPFFRPPYGAYNATTIKAAGATGHAFVVGWDVDTNDWTGLSSAAVARNAVSNAKEGSIILMHTQWNSAKALPAIIKGLRAKGLEPVGLDKLAHDAGLM